MIGLVLGCLGMVILFYDQLMVTRFDRRVVLAALALVTGAAGGSLSLVLVKGHLNKVNPFLLTFHQSWMGVIFLAFIGMFLESGHSLQITGKVGLSILYLAVLGTALAFVLYYRLLQTMSALTMALIPYITPIVALAADYLVFGETLTVRAAVGIVVIFAGIGLTQTRPGKIVPDGLSHG
jgi:drug/metabolite transporter (DMT)-like permease